MSCQISLKLMEMHSKSLQARTKDLFLQRTISNQIARYRTAKIRKIREQTTPQLVELKSPSRSIARILAKVVHFRTMQTLGLTRLFIAEAAANPQETIVVLSSLRSKKRPKTCERADLNRCDWQTNLPSLIRANSSYSRVDAASFSQRTSSMRRSYQRIQISACTSGRPSRQSGESAHLPGSAIVYSITAAVSQKQTLTRCSTPSISKDSRATMITANSALVVRLFMREGARSTKAVKMPQAQVNLS